MNGYSPLSWLSLGSLIWSLSRVALVWLGFHGVGSLFGKLPVVKRYFALLPSAVPGMLLYMALFLVLSLLGVLTRTAVAVSAAAGAIICVFQLAEKRRSPWTLPFRKTGKWLFMVPVTIALFLVVTGTMIAGRPELAFNDTQVTYLVQPDRWLDQGRIHFIDETVFSAFPLVSEMLLLLPCSLSMDMMDQMVMGQLFCFSMLVALCLSALRIAGLDKRWLPAASIGIFGCTILVLWSHFAKPDSSALYFVTLSLLTLLRQLEDGQRRFELSAFLLMGMGLATKYTSYLVLLPFGIMCFYGLARGKLDRRILLPGLMTLGILPFIFALRTAIHTGSPFYPYSPFPRLVKPEWRMPDIELSYELINDRSSSLYPSVGLLDNIYHYFRTWGPAILVFPAGILSAFRRREMRTPLVVLLSILAYSALAIAVFSPTW